MDMRLDIMAAYSYYGGMKKIILGLSAVLLVPSLAACKEEKPASNAPVQEGELQPLSVPAPKEIPPQDLNGDGYVSPRYSQDGVNKYQLGDSMVGDWTGPEGTSLKIERDGEEYKITVTNLDGPRSFPAKASDDGIEFERDGKKEWIRLGDGQDTGMKWLADKIDCAVINPGSEGFCRDQTEPTDTETK